MKNMERDTLVNQVASLVLGDTVTSDVFSAFHLVKGGTFQDEKVVGRKDVFGFSITFYPKFDDGTVSNISMANVLITAYSEKVVEVEVDAKRVGSFDFIVGNEAGEGSIQSMRAKADFMQGLYEITKNVDSHGAEIYNMVIGQKELFAA